MQVSIYIKLLSFARYFSQFKLLLKQQINKKNISNKNQIYNIFLLILINFLMFSRKIFLARKKRSKKGPFFQCMINCIVREWTFKSCNAEFRGHGYWLWSLDSEAMLSENLLEQVLDIINVLFKSYLFSPKKRSDSLAFFHKNITHISNIYTILKSMYPF